MVLSVRLRCDLEVRPLVRPCCSTSCLSEKAYFLQQGAYMRLYVTVTMFIGFILLVVIASLVIILNRYIYLYIIFKYTLSWKRCVYLGMGIDALCKKLQIS